MRNAGERFMNWLGWTPIAREKILDEAWQADALKFRKDMAAARSARDRAQASWNNAEARIAELEREKAALAAELALMVQVHGSLAEARRLMFQQHMRDMNEQAARLTA